MPDQVGEGDQSGDQSGDQTDSDQTGEDQKRGEDGDQEGQEGQTARPHGRVVQTDASAELAEPSPCMNAGETTRELWVGRGQPR